MNLLVAARRAGKGPLARPSSVDFLTGLLASGRAGIAGGPGRSTCQATARFRCWTDGLGRPLGWVYGHEAQVWPADGAVRLALLDRPRRWSCGRKKGGSEATVWHQARSSWLAAEADPPELGSPHAPPQGTTWCPLAWRRMPGGTGRWVTRRQAEVCAPSRPVHLSGSINPNTGAVPGSARRHGRVATGPAHRAEGRRHRNESRLQPRYGCNHATVARLVHVRFTGPGNAEQRRATERLW